MLLQLSSLSEVPRSDGAVQASGPQLGAIIGNVNTTGPVGVALELPAEKHTVIRSNKMATDSWKCFFFCFKAKALKTLEEIV